MDNKLVDSGLFGKGLILIANQSLVDRYNACLKDIGIAPTALNRFSIDCLGWSPEIADERKKVNYLSNGDANQYGIILTPEQERSPVYFPFHSYDRSLLAQFFKMNIVPIAEITAVTGIWLEFDNDISQFIDPTDLLMVDQVTVRSFTPDRLMVAAREQRAMVQAFMKNDDWWMNDSNRQRLVDSFATRGDLLTRSMVIPDFHYTNIRSFFTNAFGGVYVFRPAPNGENILVIQNKKLAKEYGEHFDFAFWIGDANLLDVLHRTGLVDVEIDYYRHHEDQTILSRMKECLLIDELYKGETSIDFSGMSTAQKKQLVQNLSPNAQNLYHQVERFDKKLKQGISNEEIEIPESLWKILIHPPRALDEGVREVVWKLISELYPEFVLRYYKYNRNKFFELFAKWPEQKQEWAIKRLQLLYKTRS